MDEPQIERRYAVVRRTDKHLGQDLLRLFEVSRAVGIENLSAHIGMIGAQPDHRREILRILFEGLPEQAFRLGERQRQRSETVDRLGGYGSAHAKPDTAP